MSLRPALGWRQVFPLPAPCGDDIVAISSLILPDVAIGQT
jgi:hypothetical protein